MDNSGKSLLGHFVEGRPYLVVMRNGHEYNCFLDEKSEDGWITGKVARRMTVTLYDAGEGQSLSISVDPDENIKDRFKGRDVYVQEPCHVRHPWQAIRVWADDISLLEDSWRRPLTLGPDGAVDEGFLVVAFPEFAPYRREGGGFAANPNATGPVFVPVNNTVRLLPREPLKL